MTIICPRVERVSHTFGLITEMCSECGKLIYCSAASQVLRRADSSVRLTCLPCSANDVLQAIADRVTHQGD